MKRRATHFPYLFWHWTCEHENLFMLDRSELGWFALFVQEAEKWREQ